MTTLELFVLVIGCFYLAEAVIVVKPGAILLWNRAFGSLRPDDPESRLHSGQDHGDFTIAPLLPCAPCCLVDTWPMTLSADALSSESIHPIPPDGRRRPRTWALSWSDIESIDRQRRVLVINRDHRLRFCTDAAAERFRSFLEQVRQADGGEREALIEAEMNAFLDLERATAQHVALSRHKKVLGAACVALFLLVFVGIPLSERLIGPTGRGPLLAAYLLLLATVVGLCWRAESSLLGASAGRRIASAVQALFSPAHALHAFQNVARDAFIRCHPLAVSRVASSDTDFERLARRMMAGVSHPKPGSSPLPAERERLGRFLEQCGLSLASLLAPPPREDPDCRTYCPRCERQYLLEEGTCGDCEVALIALEPPPGASEQH